MQQFGYNCRVIYYLKVLYYRIKILQLLQADLKNFGALESCASSSAAFAGARMYNEFKLASLPLVLLLLSCYVQGALTIYFGIWQ